MSVRNREFLATEVILRALGVAITWVSGGIRLFTSYDGQALPGRGLLKVYPNALRKLAPYFHTVLISGTNGKTTTTALTFAALGEAGVSNKEGANLPFAIATTLITGFSRQPSSAFPSVAVLEVDEAYLGSVCKALRASCVVLLNLSRDQLDRNVEVRKLAFRWRGVCEANPEVTFIANCDDPLVAFAASQAKKVVWVAGGQSWHSDSTGCANCEGRIIFKDDEWSCGSCGLSRPKPRWRIDSMQSAYRDEVLIGEVSLAIPGEFNLRNALFAVAVSDEISGETEQAMAKMASISSIGGRYESLRVEGKNSGAQVRLFLSKNPAGWLELISLAASAAQRTKIVLGLNAEIADGKDTSWIWDVPFEGLGTIAVIVTGTRSIDLELRLKYAGIVVRRIPNQLEAIHAACLEADDVTYLGNYTSFQQLRKLLKQSGITSDVKGR